MGGEHFGLGAVAVEAEGMGRGEAITLCPVVVVREKEVLSYNLLRTSKPSLSLRSEDRADIKVPSKQSYHTVSNVFGIRIVE